MNDKGREEAEPLVMPWLFSKRFRKEAPETIRDIRERFTRGYLARNSDAFDRQLRANITHNLKGRLKAIAAPTLILVGRDDPLTPRAMAEGLKAEIPNAKMVVFERGGHGLYWEVPDLFNRTVLDFLSDYPIT